MLRETTAKKSAWAEKTMSLLREQKLHACEDRLFALPDFNLFDDINDVDAELLWSISYDSQEQSQVRELHTIAGMRKLVLDRLAEEATLLSVEETMLVEALVQSGGQLELRYDGQYEVAESLVHRLWCSAAWDEDHIWLYMPPEIIVPLKELSQNKQTVEMRMMVFSFGAMVRAKIYLSGILRMDEPMQHFQEEILKEHPLRYPNLVMRYFKIAFDFVYDADQNMVLIHPGLAEPEKLMDEMHVAPAYPFEVEEESIWLPAAKWLLPSEETDYKQLKMILKDVVRPEIGIDDAMDDLRMLIKQGVSFDETQQVLGTLLAVLPTEKMINALKGMYLSTARWKNMSMGVLQ